MAMRLLTLIGSLLLAVMPAVAQDEIMILESPKPASHSRARVRFEHERHAEAIDCAACHHDYDEYGVNTDDDGQRCAVCHLSGASAEAVPLVRAFHLQCKSCHAKIAARGEKSGPLMCGQCHVRRPQ